MKLEIGKKYRRNSWGSSEWLKIIDIGRLHVWGIDNEGDKLSFGLDDDWVEYQDPKLTRKVKMAPALCYDKELGEYWLTQNFFVEEKGAKDHCSQFVRWPSHPDDLKEYEIPVEDQP